MKRNEITKVINRTRLDECPYIEVVKIDGTIEKGRNWANACAKTVNEILEDNKEYEVTFDYPYNRRYYTEYGKIVVKEI